MNTEIYSTDNLVHHKLYIIDQPVRTLSYQSISFFYFFFFRVNNINHICSTFKNFKQIKTKQKRKYDSSKRNQLNFS